MTEHAEDPVSDAGSKVAQFVSLATMAAETLGQVRQQRAEAAAARDERTVRARRAEQTAARSAARLQWAPVLDARRRVGLSLIDTGLAWAASHAWREVDPEAERAAERATQRLRELRPDVMTGYDRLVADGMHPVDAMRHVAPAFDRPPARAHGPARHTTVNADRPAAGQRRRGVAPDGGRTDQPRDVRAPDVPPGQSGQQQADGLDAPVTAQQRSAPASLVRTPPEVARDGYPVPLSGQVLAAGRVEPKSAERTAPAAVRSTGLATAARASRGAR